jgi:tetraacyldisaccharide 4'-kinase
MRLHAPRFWESANLISWLFLPLACIYGLIIWFRKLAYQLGLFSATTLPVPIIIVGNIRVGGTGKTPIVIALSKALHFYGFKPGVIARAYRATSDQDESSQQVLDFHSAQEVGDEPVLIAQQLAPLNIPLWVGKKRANTALDLLKKHPQCNVLVSDDGLQHYRMGRKCARDGGRDIEIVVQDVRGNGNSFLLPAGPLREVTTRPRDLTLELVQQGSQQYDGKLYKGSLTPIFDTNQVQTVPCQMGLAYPLRPHNLASTMDSAPKSLNQLASWMANHHPDKRVAAIAGIAFPEKFFEPLRDFFPNLKGVGLPDHADFKTNPFSQFPIETYPLLLITEKDAVKCNAWLDSRVWVVPLEATLSDALLKWITAVLQRSH